MKKGKIKINCQKGGTYQIGGPIVQQPQPTQPNWFDIPKQPVQPQVPFTVNHEGVNKMKSKDKIYEKQEGGQMQFDQQVLGSYVRSLAPREQAQFLQQWEQMDETQKQELYQAIVQQAQSQPQMQDGGFVHPYDNDFYPEMQTGGAPIWNNLNATAYARNYKPSAESTQNGVGNLATSQEVGIPPAVDPFAGTTEKEVIKAAQTAVKQGSDVTRIQQALVDAGYKIKVDGVYGPKTQRAVELYQAANKLKVDGVTGKNTLNSLGLNYIDKTFKNSITRKAPVIAKPVSQSPKEKEAEEEQWNFYGPNNPYPGIAMSDSAKSTTILEQIPNAYKAPAAVDSQEKPKQTLSQLVDYNYGNPYLKDNGFNRLMRRPAYFDWSIYSDNGDSYTIQDPSSGRIMKVDKKTGQPIK